AAVARGAGGAAGPAADPDATPGDASAEPDVLGFAEDADRFDDPPLDPEFDPTAPAREIAAAREQEEKFRRIAELDPDRRRDILVLREILESDPDYEVRIEAAEQLAFSVRRAAVNALKGGLDDGDPRVVAAVIEGIEFTGGTADTAALVPLLNDPDPEVRRLAAEAIEFLE
ncbi:MAG: HEAT repeat domain-containing protein, partial [Deltaproteobacteria bacterium]